MSRKGRKLPYFLLSLLFMLSSFPFTSTNLFSEVFEERMYVQLGNTHISIVTWETQNQDVSVGSYISLLNLFISIQDDVMDELVLSYYEILHNGLVIVQNIFPEYLNYHQYITYNISHVIEFAQTWDSGIYSVTVHYFINGEEIVFHVEPFILSVGPPCDEADEVGSDYDFINDCDMMHNEEDEFEDDDVIEEDRDFTWDDSINMGVVTITNPPLNAPPIPRQNLFVSWNAFSQATHYVITLRHNGNIIYGAETQNLNYTLSQNLFIPGQSYEIRVQANIGSNFRGSDELFEFELYNEANNAIAVGSRWITIAQPQAQTVTISFNRNGGIQQPQPIHRIPGDPIGPLPLVNRTDYHFAGWWTHQFGGTQISANTPTPISNTTYWARWTPIEIGAITITNPHEGARVPHQNLTVSWTGFSGATSYTITLRRQGLVVFSENVGMSTSRIIWPHELVSGQNHEITVQANLLNPFSLDDELYRSELYEYELYEYYVNIIANSVIARGVRNFTVDSQVTLTFSGNGWTPFTQTIASTPGSQIGALPVVDNRPGYTFTGWWTQQIGGNRVLSSTITPNNNTTYWAQWTRNVVDLTFLGNGGTPVSQILTRTPGFQIGTLPSINQRSGWVFTGWWTQSAGGQRINWSTIAPNQNASYWAQWLPVGNITFTNPIHDGVQVPLGNVFVSWGWNQHAVNYEIIVRDMSSNQIVYSNWTASTNHSIPQHALIARRNYVITVNAHINNPTATSIELDENGEEDHFDREVKYDELAEYNEMFFEILSTVVATGTRWFNVQIPPVTLTFHDNNGTSNMQTLLRTPGTAMTNMPVQPTRHGHIFMGWFDTPAQTGGTRFTASSFVPHTNTQYWARWIPVANIVITNPIYDNQAVPFESLNITWWGNDLAESYRVILHNQTTNMPVINTIVSSTSLFMPQSALLAGHSYHITVRAYNFNLQSLEDELVYDRGFIFDREFVYDIEHYYLTLNSVVAEGMRTFTVQIPQVTLTFNNGINASPPTNTLIRTPGQFIGELPSTPHRPGYQFQGWWTEPNGGVRATEATIVPGGDTVYFARWVGIPIINVPSSNNTLVILDEIKAAGGLLVTWQAIEGVNFDVRLRDFRFPDPLPHTFQHETSGTSVLIPAHLFATDVAFRVAVRAFTVDGLYAWGQSDTFMVEEPQTQPGITVVVRDSLGQPIENAIVHFVRDHNTRSEFFARTNQYGIAIFANAPNTTWGINITHADWASTYHTSRRITRSAANPIQREYFTMSVPRAPLLALGWVPVLEGMPGTSSERTFTYQNNSIYMFRRASLQSGGNTHAGIDLVVNASPGTIRNHEIYSAFTGYVIRVYTSTTAGTQGRGVAIRYHDEATREWYLASYFHMLNAPVVRLGQRVEAGAHIGNVGDTGSPGNFHLHLDIHRSSVPPADPYADPPVNPPTMLRNRENTIDPRAFFSFGFVVPRHESLTLPARHSVPSEIRYP